jgi:hypothetical protein
MHIKKSIVNQLFSKFERIARDRQRKENAAARERLANRNEAAKAAKVSAGPKKPSRRAADENGDE